MRTAYSIATLSLVSLASLGGCTPEPENIFGENPTLSGHIESWPGSEGFAASASFMSNPSSCSWLTNGSVDSDGDFSLVLPGGESVSSCLVLASSGYQVTAEILKVPTVSPSDLKIAYLALRVRKEGASTRNLQSSSVEIDSIPKAEDITVRYVYADQEGRIEGEETWINNRTWRPGGGSTRYDVALRRGWNTLVTRYISHSVSSQYAHSSTEVKAGVRPPAVKWWMLP